MRAFIVDNGLVDHTGHHFNNSAGLRDEFARHGFATRMLVHRQAAPVLVESLGARAVFDFGPYDRASGDPLSGPIENLILQGRSFADGLSAITAEVSVDDIVLVPSTLQNELHGCALWLAQLPPERRPRLVLNFILENFFALGTRNLGLVASLYRFAARQLERVSAGDRLLLTTAGREMSEWLARVLAQPVALFPIPKTYPSQARPAEASGRPPRVAILGHSRAEKGFHLVPAILARHPDVRFLVQIAPAGAESLWPDGGASMRATANVELVQGTLDRESYDALLSRADVVLLPYDPLLMPLRASGVFAEAVAAAKVAVVPAGTWMSEHLAEGNGAGVAFERFDVASISAALERALAHFDALGARARDCAPAWRAAQSSQSYVDRVLAQFGIPGPQQSH